MRNVQGFLDTLSDSEVVFLHAYRMSDYTAESKEMILRELITRGLGPVAMDHILRTATFNPDNDGCKRCNSQKRWNDNQCLVCGWPDAMEKGVNRPGWKTLLKVIGGIAEFFGNFLGV